MGDWTFVLLTLFVIMSPGVDTALITKRTLLEGRKDGFQMAMGLASGSMVHTIAVAFGLSAILLKSALAFEVVKYIGALYLIYLGLSTFIRRKQRLEELDTGEDFKKVSSAFKQGFLSNILNPKVAVFFLTFLPQFVTNDNAAMWQLIVMGLTYTVLSIVWFLFYVYFINYVRKWLMAPRVQNIMDKGTGLVLVGFGLTLALEKRP